MTARSPLQVCHVIHNLAPGGAERVLVELARTASHVAVVPSVITVMASQGAAYAEELRELGVPVTDLGRRERWDPRSLTLGLSAMRRLRPDVIHTHLKHADLVGGYASWRLDVPMVSTLHAIEDSVTPVRRLKRRLGAEARLRVARRTIAVSDAQRRWYLDAFHADAGRVVTIRNGITVPDPSAEARRQARAALGVADDEVVAVMLSVMRPGKGHAQLLEAAARLPHASKLRIVLAGDGPLRPELERQVDDWVGVQFIGWHPDPGRLLAGADFLVHPTLFDALPTALIEALGAGLPVVASDVGGVPEIVTPECGILVPPGDPGALREAMLALAADPRRRRQLGECGRRRYDEQFSALRWAERLRALYDEVIEEG